MASPFSVFRDNLKPLMVVLTLLALLSFVVLPAVQMYLQSNTAGPSNTVVATFNGGTIDTNEVAYYQSVLGQTNRFLAELDQRTIAAGGFPSVPNYGPDGRGGKSLGISTSYDPTSIVLTKLYARQASKLGLEMDDVAVSQWLNRFSDNKFSNAQLAALRAQTSQNRLGQSQLYEVLRTELLANLYIRTLDAGLMTSRDLLIPPADAWRNFLKLSQRAKISAYPVSVETFISQTSEPTASTIQALYEEGKERFPSPSSPDPGFRRYYSAVIEYVYGDLEDYVQEEIGKLTEDQLRAEYEQRKAAGRYILPPMDLNVTPPAATGVTEPAVTQPESTELAPAEPEMTEPAPAPAEEPAPAPAEEPAPAPAEEPAPAPAEEPAPAPAEEPAPAPTEDPAPSPAEEPAPAPAEEPAPAPAEEPAPAPAEEPAPAPAEEPAPAPAEEPAPAPAEEPTGDESASTGGRSSYHLTATRAQEPGEQPQPPAEDVPGEQPPVEETPVEETEPAQPPTDAPASEEPATEEPSTETSSSETSEAATPAQPPTFEEVRDEIARELATEPARARLQRAIDTVYNTMQVYSDRLAYYKDATQLNVEAEEPARPDLKALAEANGLKYELTKMIDPLAAQDLSIGTSRSNSGEALISLIYNPERSAFFPVRTTNIVEGLEFAAWKTEVRESYIPELNDVRDEVIAAAKLLAARELAQKRAQEIADKANSSAESTLVDAVPAEDQAKVKQDLGPFPWMMYFGFGEPIMGSVPELDQVGGEFMEAVFTGPVGQCEVAPSRDKSIFYVVKTTEVTPPADQLRDRYMQSNQRNPAIGLGASDLIEIRNGYLTNLREELGIQWNEEALGQ